jgi:hypothetical protein
MYHRVTFASNPSRQCVCRDFLPKCLTFSIHMQLVHLNIRLFRVIKPIQCQISVFTCSPFHRHLDYYQGCSASLHASPHNSVQTTLVLHNRLSALSISNQLSLSIPIVCLSIQIGCLAIHPNRLSYYPSKSSKSAVCLSIQMSCLGPSQSLSVRPNRMSARKSAVCLYIPIGCLLVAAVFPSCPSK